MLHYSEDERHFFMLAGCLLRTISLNKVALLWFCLCAFPISAYALRCGTALVQEGDSSYEVLRKCGDPSYIEEFTEYIYVYREHGDRGTRIPYRVPSRSGEKWTYNFGRQRFMRALYFVDGRIWKIETLGYGFRR